MRESFRSFSRDRSVTEHRLAPGTVRRVLGFARPYRRWLLAFLALIILDAVLAAATPLIFKAIIDDGIANGDEALVVALAALVAGIAVVTRGRRRRAAVVLGPDRRGAHPRPAHRRCSTTSSGCPSASSAGPRPVPW